MSSASGEASGFASMATNSAEEGGNSTVKKKRNLPGTPGKSIPSVSLSLCLSLSIYNTDRYILTFTSKLAFSSESCFFIKWVLSHFALLTFISKWILFYFFFFFFFLFSISSSFGS